jgi:signal transduction histidine kinase/DNA-binding response OmpR family regulator
MTETSSAAEPSRPIVVPLVWAGLLTLVGMTLFEVLRQYSLPADAVWVSHGITIAVGTLVAVVVTRLSLRSSERFRREIAERRRVEQVLIQSERQSVEMAAAKADFLATMSHEIRTPMHGIIGMTELVLDTDLNTTQREYLSMVKTSADSLLGILNDVLDFSKIEQGRLEIEAIPFSVRDQLAEMLKPLVFRAEQKGLELICHVLPNVPGTVVGDPGRIQQVLTNLIGNAIKFTERGQILVQLEMASQRSGVTELHYFVSDSGIGIPQNKQAAIFEPFRQADGSTTRRYGGTGLGLTIASTLVELMGGHVWVDSKPHEGSTFHFTVRLALSQARPEILTWSVTGLRVLVVDDNPANRRLFQTWLERWKMVPTVVGDGAAALVALVAAQATGKPYALVLLDASMPGMDGFEVARRILETSQLAGVTVMMLSSSGQPGEQARCEALHIVRYLTKPIEPKDLLAAIGRALALEQSPRSALAPAMLPADLPERRLHILVAEDNIVNQRIAAGFLQKRGHRVTIAGNGKEALAAFDRERFDAVLMDVQMPDMDGIEATLGIREREATTTSHVPIIAMTAHALKGDRERMLGAGMDDYLSKPVDAKELVGLVEAITLTKGVTRDLGRSPLASTR